jgi:uncharacterized protein (DUF58 family)
MELDKEILHFLDRLDFTPRIRTTHPLVGRHRSPLFGRTPEFMEYKVYAEGDERSDIDWRATARSKHTLVRRHEHQGLCHHWLVLDGSGSMGFGDGDEAKYRVQLFLMGALVHLLSSQGDATGVVLETHGGPQVFPPLKTREALSELIRAVAAHEPTGAGSGMVKGLAKLAEGLRRPSVVWIMSDLDGPTEQLMERVHQLGSRGHDVRYLHIHHPRERDLGWSGELLFCDLEGSDDELSLRPKELAKAYVKEYQSHVQAAIKGFEREGVLYTSVDVSRPLSELITQAIMDGAGRD